MVTLCLIQKVLSSNHSHCNFWNLNMVIPRVRVFRGSEFSYPYPYPRENPCKTRGYTRTRDIHYWQGLYAQKSLWEKEVTILVKCPCWCCCMFHWNRHNKVVLPERRGQTRNWMGWLSLLRNSTRAEVLSTNFPFSTSKVKLDTAGLYDATAYSEPLLGQWDDVQEFTWLRL